MKEPTGTPGPVRFGAFEADLSSGELRKHGLRIKLPDQSFQVLAMLVERPRQMVTREELHKKLWPADTFVDFEHGLNNAINRLREALGDSAETPRFIETLPRRGYRFVASVDTGATAAAELAQRGSAAASPVAEPPVAGAEKPLAEAPARVLPLRMARKLWIGAVAFAAILALLIGANVRGLRGRLLGRAAPAPVQSIAVLPLENLSGDPAQGYFVDGMTDELITDLGKMGELRVISRTSAMHYKGTRKTLPEIARELNVDAVIEGAVLRSGDRVRITAQLIRTAPEQHLWAEEFQGELRDVLALQSQVARAIAAQVRAKLTQQQMQLASTRTINPEAYEYYLKGRYNFWERWSKEGYNNAIRYFQMAIEKDPSYAPAYAGLAHCYAVGIFQGQELPPREAWSKAAAAAKKALELDDQLAEAHIAMAVARFRFDWNWPEAEREFKRGLELSPNDALGHTSYAVFLGLMRRLDEAMAEATRARELDPLSPPVSTILSFVYSCSRRWDEAIAESRRTLQLDPNFILAHGELARRYEEKGMYAEAVSEWLKWHGLTGHSPEQIESLRNAFAVSGIRGFWEKSLEWEKRQLNQPQPPYIEMARVCARLGRTDEAFHWLEKAYEARYPTMPNINIAAWLDPVRSDPRYVDLARRVGLPP
jgi:TolB-like protein/DNA-binding winged helix-turn-helix (wHTH) protein